MEGIGEVNGIIDWLFNVGIEASEAMPLLLFIGIGAMIDFGDVYKRQVEGRGHGVSQGITGQGKGPPF